MTKKINHRYKLGTKGIFVSKTLLCGWQRVENGSFQFLPLYFLPPYHDYDDLLTSNEV